MRGRRGNQPFFKNFFPEKKYVPVDDPFIEEQSVEQPEMFMMLNPPPVIYDEVQRAPNLFRYIKIKCDESDERGLFCLSGSQPLELMEGVSESLQGASALLSFQGFLCVKSKATALIALLFRQWSTFRSAVKVSNPLIITHGKP